jgi:hypothetical protein
MIFANLLSIIAAVFVFFIFGFSEFTLYHALIGLMIGLFYVLAIYFYCLAVQGGEVSRIIPLFNLIPSINI